MEHAAVEEKLAGFVDGGVDAFHGFAAIDVQQQVRILHEIFCGFCSLDGYTAVNIIQLVRRASLVGILDHVVADGDDLENAKDIFLKNGFVLVFLILFL